MGSYLAAIAAGFLFLPFLPSLPPYWLMPIVALVLLTLAIVFRYRWLWLLFCLSISFAWSVGVADHALKGRLLTLWEGQTLTATGFIRGIPESTDQGIRFRFAPEKVENEAGEIVPVKGHWHLFYGQKDEPLPDSYCHLAVRLKRPHGVVNPGGFDTEAWLLSEGITASGSVRSISCDTPAKRSVDGLRLALRHEFLEKFPDEPIAGVVLSLISGDRSLVLSLLWERYVATGVVHLMAISGLHITMIALVVAFLLRGLLGSIPRLALHLPLNKAALVGGFLLAWAYSLMAGYSVPTERTLIMLMVVLGVQFFDRRLPTVQTLLIAMIVVLFMSPLAIHSTGFWLSFGAVSILLMLGRSAGELPAWRTLITIQFVLTLLLLPLTLWFFERVSWVSPLANLIAVPAVTFLVVPLGLLGLLMWLLGGGTIAFWLWKAAIFLMTILDALLEQFESWPFASMDWSLTGGWALFWLTLGILVVVQPAQRRLWWLAPFFGLALWQTSLAPSSGELRMTVLDVGQGLSVLLQTQHHQLLYDTGPPIGNSSDAAIRYILPALHSLGVYRLDGLILSHDDSDHTGGAASLLANMPLKWVLGVIPQTVDRQRYTDIDWQPCREGQVWDWDGWHFELLYPSEEDALTPLDDNNRSCVLHVSRGAVALLLPGDLASKGEKRLLSRFPEKLKSDVLVLGHHGSKGSSSLPWVAAASPQWAIVSAGYRNPFKHPHVSLIQRLEHTGIQWRNTASSGAIVLELTAEGVKPPQGWREKAPRYWRDR